MDVLLSEKAKSTAELCDVRMRQRRLELEAERGRAYLLHLHSRASGREELASRRYNSVTTSWG